MRPDSNSKSEVSRDKPVVVVDLDGTLIRTDLLFESFLTLLKREPQIVFIAPFLLFRGKARLKKFLAEKIALDPKSLPYRPALLKLIEEKRAQGSEIILASASHQSLVAMVARYLNLFSSAIGSKETNLKGKNKLDAIMKITGGRGFEYMGNSSADLPLWWAANKAILLNPSKRLVSKVAEKIDNFEVIRDQGHRIREFFRLIRIHQWIKNTLVFVPLLAGHYYSSVAHWCQAILAFFSFSLLSSGVYIANDLLDIQSDRDHRIKRNRPFASGSLPIYLGFLAVPSFIIASVVSALPLGLNYLSLLASYVVINLFYFFRFKRAIMLDVVILAGLYSLRVFAGGVACNITVSYWLLAFCTFFFFGLAMVKRYSELQGKEPGDDDSPSRGYLKPDQTAIMAIGINGSLLSVLVMALYFNSIDVLKIYRHPERLWLVIPLLLYWIGRTWILAHRGKIHEDPVVWAMTDRNSWLSGILFIVILGFSA